MSGKRENMSGIPCGKRQKVSSRERKTAAEGIKRHFKTSLQFMKFLLSPIKFEAFKKEYWEQKPLVLQNRDGPSTFYPVCFTKGMFFPLTNAMEILFERDIAACKYVDGKRTNFEQKGRATVKKLEQLLKEKGATLQVHQPQRWIDGLWEALEQMECLFGCLVGCNAYITPPRSQGLAPHHDDVEVFVLQLEGVKSWKLYKPPSELPRTYSKDFSQDEIGSPTHEFTLQPGDLLYMPRGTIHQAHTPDDSDSHSTHITISTYQAHSVGEYLKSVLPDLVEQVMDSTVELRRGLPLGFFPACRMGKSTIESAVEHFQEQLKNLSGAIPRPHDLVRDFMLTRLPPFRLERGLLSETPDGEPPTLNSCVTLTFPSHVTYLLDESGDEREALLLTSVHNDRETHMMLSDEHDENETGIVRFPEHFLPALKQICRRRDFIKGEELDLPKDEEKTVFLTTLWSLHLLTVQ
ncbi:ribosomal oxygenase 2-like [Ornithodoros turicata]|uniref:ribosomal oxygenase 2-like n=1 Tax=Ornithodoros turicata TaxID=34597 RepID=UPI0031398ACA